MTRPGRMLFFLRNHLAGAPLILALFTSMGEWEHDAAVWSAALTVTTSGVALRAWSSCHCNYAGRKPALLAVTGPYSLVRNPLYLGNILLIVGATIASELLWLAPVSALWAFAVYATAVAVYEEPMMHRRYGEAWERYAAAVPAWVPALRLPAMDAPSFLASLAPQSLRLLWLVPFLLKELKWFGLGH